MGTKSLSPNPGTPRQGPAQGSYIKFTARAEAPNRCSTHDCVQLWIYTFTHRKNICCQISCVEIQQWAVWRGLSVSGGRRVFSQAPSPHESLNVDPGLARVSSSSLCSVIRKASQVFGPQKTSVHCSPHDSQQAAPSTSWHTQSLASKAPSGSSMVVCWNNSFSQGQITVVTSRKENREHRDQCGILSSI